MNAVVAVLKSIDEKIGNGGTLKFNLSAPGREISFLLGPGRLLRDYANIFANLEELEAGHEEVCHEVVVHLGEGQVLRRVHTPLGTTAVKDLC